MLGQPGRGALGGRATARSTADILGSTIALGGCYNVDGPSELSKLCLGPLQSRIWQVLKKPPLAPIHLGYNLSDPADQTLSWYISV